MGETRKTVQVGDAVELRTLGAGRELRWTPAKVVHVEENENFIVFETESGQRPAYGYDDEGGAWRRGRWVACPACKGTGHVLAPTSENR